MENKDKNIAKFNAAIEAITDFSVWRDGVQWVNDMRTLKEVREILLKKFNLTEEDLSY